MNAAPPVPSSAASAPTSGLAIGSLVCGILGFPTLGLAGIAAVVLGHVSLSKIKRAGGALKGKGVAVAGLVLGYFSVLILLVAMVAGLITPLILRQQQAAERVAMGSNTKQIGLALLEFHQEFGSLPSDDTAEAVKSATGTNLPLTGGDVFRQIETYGIEMQPLLTVSSRTEGDWTYFPGVTLEDDPGQAVLVSPDVRGEALVLQVDLSVQRVPSAQADALRTDPAAVTIPAVRP